MRKISESTVRRLCGYLRLLEEFQRAGKTTVSSDELAVQGHTTPAQVRKDLSLFGSFGKRGLGYDVLDLTDRLRPGDWLLVKGSRGMSMENVVHRLVAWGKASNGT